MSDVLKPVIGGNPIKNGSMVVYHTETGSTSKRDPDLNSFPPSGTLFTRLNERFDEHYGGGAS
jgi:hypothetical protein